MLHRLSLVTGVDAGMFSQLLLLGGSLRRYSPGLALHVCDFGLTEAQRAYVRRRHVLLDKPPEIRARHPWDYKANLGRYVAALPCDASVWIDAERGRGHVILTNATRDGWFAKDGLNEFRRMFGQRVWQL